jgi:hypothetical protein
VSAHVGGRAQLWSCAEGWAAPQGAPCRSATPLGSAAPEASRSLRCCCCPRRDLSRVKKLLMLPHLCFSRGGAGGGEAWGAFDVIWPTRPAALESTGRNRPMSVSEASAPAAEIAPCGPSAGPATQSPAQVGFGFRPKTKSLWAAPSAVLSCPHSLVLELQRISCSEGDPTELRKDTGSSPLSSRTLYPYVTPMHPQQW